MTWIAQGTNDWSYWTPSLTATGSNPTGYVNLNLENIYQRNGDLVTVRFRVYTSSTSGNSIGTGSWRLSLPVQPKHSAGHVACGDWYLYNSQQDAWNISWFGWVALHSTSQSTSTVEFVPQYHTSGGNSLSVLPTGISYPTRYVDFGGQFFYEAL